MLFFTVCHICILQGHELFVFHIFFFLPDLIKELCTEKSFERKNTFICKISKYKNTRTC